MKMKFKAEKHKKRFSLKAFIALIEDRFNQLGQSTVYSALLMYYAFKEGGTPGWAKHIILGALGYVLTPIDSIPDLTPVIGYTDDLGVLSFGLVTIACYINQDVREKSLKKLNKVFKSVDTGIVEQINNRL